MLKTITSGLAEDYHDYLYGVTDPGEKAYFENKLNQLFMDLETDFNSYVNDDSGFRCITRLMGETQFRVELALDSSSTNEFLTEFIDYRKSENILKGKNYDVAERLIDMVDKHIMADLDAEKLTIRDIPRNKQELKKLIEYDINILKQSNPEAQKYLQEREQVCDSTRYHPVRERVSSAFRQSHQNDNLLNLTNNISDVNLLESVELGAEDPNAKTRAE